MKFWHVLIGVVCVILLWMLGGLWFPSYMTEFKNIGAFGDQFGSVNALFSGLAFAGVIYAVILQSKELQLQREELKQTRDVLEDQKQQLEEQNKTMQQQRFENTFFQMLSLHNEIVGKMKYSNEVGKSSFSRILSHSLQHINTGQLKDLPSRVSNQFYNLNTVLGNYFENLHIILKMVDKSAVEDKNFYTSILHAQLSTAEISIIFYYGLGTEQGDIKSLIEHYSFFEGLQNSAIEFLEIKTLYSSQAFGKQALQE